MNNVARSERQLKERDATKLTIMLPLFLTKEGGDVRGEEAFSRFTLSDEKLKIPSLRLSLLTGRE
jgi:hypothetical protein